MDAVTHDKDAATAIHQIAQFVIAYEDGANPLCGNLDERYATGLASAYFAAWTAWGKPLNSNHRAVAALVFGDRLSPPVLLAQAMRASLDANEPGWRAYCTVDN